MSSELAEAEFAAAAEESDTRIVGKKLSRPSSNLAVAELEPSSDNGLE